MMLQDIIEIAAQCHFCKTRPLGETEVVECREDRDCECATRFCDSRYCIPRTLGTFQRCNYTTSA